MQRTSIELSVSPEPGFRLAECTEGQEKPSSLALSLHHPAPGSSWETTPRPFFLQPCRCPPDRCSGCSLLGGKRTARPFALAERHTDAGQGRSSNRVISQAPQQGTKRTMTNARYTALILIILLTGCREQTSPTEPLPSPDPSRPQDGILADDGIASVTEDIPRRLARSESIIFTVTVVGRPGIEEFQTSRLTVGFPDPFTDFVQIALAQGAIRTRPASEYPGGGIVMESGTFSAGTNLLLRVRTRVKPDYPTGSYPVEIHFSASQVASTSEKRYVRRLWTEIHDGPPPTPKVPTDVVQLDDGAADVYENFPRSITPGQEITFTVSAVGKPGIGQFSHSGITFSFLEGSFLEEWLELVSFEGRDVITTPPSTSHAGGIVLHGGEFSAGTRLGMTVRVRTKTDPRPGLYQLAVDFATYNTADDVRRYSKRFWILLE
jgi:hypothetical protein